MAEHQRPRQPSEKVQYLNDDEINEFLDHVCPRSSDGYVSRGDVEQKLDQAWHELVRQPGAHRTVRRDYDADNRQALLRSIMGPDQQRVPRGEFARRIRECKIPSLRQVERQDEEETSYFARRSSWRKTRAYWAVHGPEILFVGLVVSMQVAFGVWQLVKYQTSPDFAAFGWGATVAKACAGALYPTFFFLILSISRYFSTLMRRSYYLSRFFNWDLSQKFHIRISCVALVLVTIHALGHLTGTFIHGSDSANKEAVALVIGHKVGGRYYYIDFIRSVPGFTGATALGLFYILSLLSIPQVRRWNYNVFQLGHLLVYPIIGLMMAHGTDALLQQPIFGYFLAFPTFLILFERLSRVLLGFYRIKATLEVLDGETVEIAAVIPKYRLWDYTAGQYIFLQVPAISFFQWHPFTISFCRGKKMILHIKTDGDWTARLRQLGPEIEVGINGPFGAPAQRFYDFKYSVIIGAGIGVTPFSAILADLQHKNDLDHGGPPQREVSRRDSAAAASGQEPTGAQSGGRGLHHPRTTDEPNVVVGKRKPWTSQPHASTNKDRRTDFHWIVRDGNYLLWLSDLLNKVSISQKWHREHDEYSHLDIRINTHVTAKRSHIATHVYSWLLEMNRTEENPASPLTGLLNPTRFGRPDFDKILDEHYEEMRQTKQSEGSSPRASSSDHYKVGVFYCGAAAVGEILADKCSELTIRGRDDGSKIEYHFMIEVFG